jgi:hypothetical protein
MNLQADDPDAAARDRASAEAVRYADAITLPPGYDIVRRENHKAATPQENRGGGQPGDAAVVFRVSDRPTSQVAAEVNDWFIAHGFQTSGYGKPECTGKVLHLAWAKDAYVVTLLWVRGGVPGRDSVVKVPYYTNGLVAPGYPTGIPLPPCS